MARRVRLQFGSVEVSRALFSPKVLLCGRGMRRTIQESLESGSPLPYLVTIDALQRRFDLRHGVRVLFGSLGWL